MFKEEIFKKAQAGDINSIEEICTSTWEPLYRFIYFKVQNRQEAEDITQETYAKALSQISNNNIKIDKYISFLKTVSLNIIRDRWRKNKRWGENVNYENVNPEVTSEEDHTEVSARRLLIENALKELNEEQRKVIELRIIKGYTAAETGRLMKKKEGNIRVLQYRALRKLAEILKANE